MREELEIVKHIKKTDSNEAKIDLQDIQLTPVSESKEKGQEEKE